MRSNGACEGHGNQEAARLYVALYSDELTLEVIGLPDDELAGSLRYTLRRATM